MSKSLEYVDKVNTDSIISFYTNKNGQTGIIRDSKKNIVFDVFDKDLKKIHTQIIERHKKETIVGDLFFGNEMRLFTEYAIKKNERILYCHIFNIEDNTHSQVKVYETLIAGRQALYSEMKDHKIAFALSNDGQYLAIASDNLDKDDDSFLVRVFHSNTLEEVYTNTFLDNSPNYFELQDLAISNEGVAYSLGKLYLDGRSEKKGGEANYKYVLNKINNGMNKALSVEMDDLHVETMAISLMENKIHLLGLFSEKSVGQVKGGCSFLVDLETFRITSNTQADLPIEVFEEIYGIGRAQRKQKKELSNFNIDYLLTDDNGNTYIVAEEFYITSSYSSGSFMGGVGGGGFGGSSSVPHYDDILILKFKSSGELEWGRGLFKRSNEHSYNAFLKDGNINIILNSGKDLLEKEDGRTKISKGFLESSALYRFTFSKEGLESNHKILDYKEGYRYLPEVGTYSNNKFIMMSSGKRRKHFAILD
tara:strand:- start:8748 stop:10181 length:1434 start_codon:yes stop_codon:yes gene_type:complete